MNKLLECPRILEDKTMDDKLKYIHYNDKQNYPIFIILKFGHYFFETNNYNSKKVPKVYEYIYTWL